MKAFLSSFITFRTIIRMSIIYLPPCSFLLALHLDWFLNTSVDKKIKFSFYICEIVFYFSLWLKLSIFFSLVLFFLEMHNRSRKKLTGKKLNVDRQFFKDVLCVNLLQEGWGSTNSCHLFPQFPSINTSLSNEDFYLFHLLLFVIALVPGRLPSF